MSLKFSPVRPHGVGDVNVFVRINDVEEAHFPIDQVTQIRVDALGGNDNVTLGSQRDLFFDSLPAEKPVNIPTHIEGDAGSDSLSGGIGNDTIVGGSHSDLIAGGGGNDLLSGRRGNDEISVGVSDPNGNSTLGALVGLPSASEESTRAAN